MSINYADWVFFQPFVLPNLKSFDLLSERSLGHFLLDLRGRSAFPLTRLELSELDMDADGLIAFLRVVPSLTELSLKQCACIEERLFAAFTHRADSYSTDVVLPFLTNLTMESREEVSREAVADMVQSLFWAADLGDGSFPLLKCIRLELTYPQYPDTPDILLKNIAATGFLVDLHEKSLVEEERRGSFWGRLGL
ncbi:hypothetical protein DFH09DRAFT_1320063 [Mycena vulgaris]|nr:hypothetical protein DFH09DRAFT_1320063 [Mycena vulgaris]